MSGGRERTYRLFVPPAYDGRAALPLVLELHGSGGTSAGQSRTSGFDDVAAREGFAVASLQADGVAVEPVRVDEFTGRRFTFFADPDGLPLELYEVTP